MPKLQGTYLIDTASNNATDQAADASAIARCRQGDASAYAELVTRYQDRLFNTLSRLVGSPDDAADLAQDAFVQAYLKLETFREDSRFYTWLYRIAFNLAMSQKRRRRPLTGSEDDAARLADQTSTGCESPEQTVMTSERVTQVQDAIGRLADDHRNIVVLREIEGCDYEQISQILEIPIGTVRSRLFRARMQLKELLGAFVEAEG